jgi:hypothetical protein
VPSDVDAGLGRLERDARRDDVRLHAPVEREARRRELRDAPFAAFDVVRTDRATRCREPVAQRVEQPRATSSEIETAGIGPLRRG